MLFVRLSCVCGAALALSGAAPAQGDSMQPRMSVEWQQGRLSVKADGVPFRELLATVASRTGVKVHGLAALEGNASVNFANLTLVGGLEVLPAPINYAMFEEPSASAGQGRIVVLVVGRKSALDSGMAEGQERGTDLQSSRSVAAPGPDTYRAVERLAEQKDVRALREAAAFGDSPTQALAMQRLARRDSASALRIATDAAGSAEVAQRVVAVQTLAGLNSPEATDALGAALQDSDLSVRQAALVGLTSRTSPAALQFLVQALQDRAPSIRLLALDLLAQKGPAGKPGVASALNDQDPAIRARAREALERVEIAR